MSLSNASENQTLKMHLQGIDPTYRADAAQYAALVSLAAPDEAAPIAAAQATPIHADAKKMNGATVIGTGAVGDPWRASGVSP